MIELTRINKEPIVVNADHIVTAERTGETVLTLYNGDKLRVLETVEVLMDRIAAFKQRTSGGTVRLVRKSWDEEE